MGRGVPALSFFNGRGPIDALRADPTVRAVYDAAVKAGVTVYIVGGALRNLALCAAPAPDYDFIVQGDAAAFSEAAAKALRGAWFLLDKETASCRVAVKSAAGAYTADFSPVKEEGVVYDLGARDFTVNALAIGLSDLFGNEDPIIIDPCNGLGDATERLLRMTSRGVFDDDPLRCLRAVRLALQYGLEIEGETLALIKLKAGLIRNVSIERVRDELVAIFSSDGTPLALRALMDTGIMGVILPEAARWGDVEGYDLLGHSIKVVEECEDIISSDPERLFPGYSSGIRAHLGGALGPVKRTAFLKMAAFFHDAGKPACITSEGGRPRFIGHDSEGGRIVKGLFTSLKFSRALATRASKAVKDHHRAFMLASLKERTARAKAHFFRATGDDAGIDLLLLALADARATSGGEDEALLRTAREMVAFYYDVYTKKRPGTLFTGREVMKAFGVSEGRIVGEILKKIAEGVEDGGIRNRKDAVIRIKKWLGGG
ncbi:MAG: HD domain-containing protein [Deltaproteobacteria bacterium]|nr:HD domain-containing protein [Deltaproteobacteria bacterium]